MYVPFFSKYNGATSEWNLKMGDKDPKAVLPMYYGEESGKDEGLINNTWVEAILNKNGLELVRGLIENGADVNESLCYKTHFFPDMMISPRIYTDEDGIFREGTPLIFALLRNNVDIAETLINSGADTNATDDHGFAPLHYASEVDCRITKLLLEKGATANITNREGSTPLHLAIRLNNAKIAEMLLNAGADANAAYIDGRTPLHAASKIGCDIIELLLEKGANVNAVDREGLNPLHVVMRENNLKIAETLIHAGADVNATDGYGFTSLLVAAWLHCPIADLLIEKGVNVNAKDHNLRSALHIALFWNNQTVAESVINAGASVNALDMDGLTPLHAVARSGCDVVELLIRKGAQPNVTDGDMYSPLHFALMYNNPAIAEKLIDVGAGLVGNPFQLKYAAIYGYENIIDKLLEIGAKVNIQDNYGDTALHWVCKNGNLGCTRLLLERGASLTIRNRRGQTALHLAKIQGHKDVAEHIEFCQSQRGFGAFFSSLLPRGVERNLQKKIDDLSRHLAEKENLCVLLRRELDAAALRIEELLAKIDAADEAAQIELKADMEVVRQKTEKIDSLHSQMEQIMASIGELQAEKCLRKEKSSMTDEQETGSVKSFFTVSFNSVMDSIKKKTSLLEAVTAGDEEQVVLLLRKNANLNVRDSDKQTPLFLACKYNRHDIVRTLINRGADVNACNKDNATPLYAASENGYADVVEFLIEHKANVNALTKNEATPLLIAADNGHVLVVETLLRKGARINMPMKGGYTPLYVASRNDRREVVEMLLEHGADVNFSSDKRMSPLHRAAIEGHREVVELLLEYGADLDAMNAKSETPVSVAEQHGKREVLDLIVSWRDMSLDKRCSLTEVKRVERKQRRARLIQISQCCRSSNMGVELATESREIDELSSNMPILNRALNSILEDTNVNETGEVNQELIQNTLSEPARAITHSEQVRNRNVTKNYIIINQGVVHGTMVGNPRDIYVELQKALN